MVGGWSGSAAALATGALEVPGDGAAVSGIGVVSGWICDARRVEIQLDDQRPMQAAYGTPRGDTRAVCGDENNGFGLLFNWNLLGDGPHQAILRADGVELARASFTVATLGTPFLRGATGSVALDFGGQPVTLEWSEAQQNFVITAVGLPPPPLPDEVPVTETDIDADCRGRGYVRAEPDVRNSAYGWRCIDRPNSMSGDPFVYYDRFVEICDAKHGGLLPFPTFRDGEDPHSWTCGTKDVPPRPMDVPAYCESLGLSAQLGDPTKPFTWFCADIDRPGEVVELDFAESFLLCRAQYGTSLPIPTLDAPDALSQTCGQRLDLEF